MTAIAVFLPSTGALPAYYVLLEWQGGKVATIRDFYHVPYIASGSRFEQR